MQQQLALSAPAAAKRCGNCVMRNAPEDKGTGHCAWHGARHWQDEACADWFSNEQGKLGLYGRGKR